MAPFIQCTTNEIISGKEFAFGVPFKEENISAARNALRISKNLQNKKLQVEQSIMIIHTQYLRTEN